MALAAAAGGGADELDDLSPNKLAAMARYHPHNYNWNIFRYIADFLHLAGIIILFYTLLKTRNSKGLSLKTQVLYALVFVTRYLDLLDHAQNFYLTTFKITFILSSLGSVGLFWVYAKEDPTSYEREKDTANVVAMLIPCCIAAIIMPKENELLEILWTFSEYLEGFAMVPQYVFCYRESEENLQRAQLVLVYIICLGGYRVFYAFNWIYKRIMNPHYTDLQSWLGGAFEIAFFADFLAYQLGHFSILRTFVLLVDDKVNQAYEAVEMKVLSSAKASGVDVGNLDSSNMRQRRAVGRAEFDETEANELV